MFYKRTRIKSKSGRDHRPNPPKFCKRPEGCGSAAGAGKANLEVNKLSKAPASVRG